MSKQQPGKRRKIIYRDAPDVKIAELEEFLFGNNGDGKTVFAKRGEPDSDDDVTLTDLLAPGGQLFFEDKLEDSDLRHQFSSSSDDDADDLDSDAAGSDDGRPANQAGMDGVGTGDIAGGRESGGDEMRRHGGGDQHSASTSQESDDHENDDDDDDDDDDSDDSLKATRTEAAAQGQKDVAERPPQGRQSVWSDAADANIHVDLTTTARLRKLRGQRNQKVVNGSTYESALRKQHKLINPRTSWAALSRKQRSAPEHQDAGGSDGVSDDGEAGQGLQGVLTRVGGILAARPARLPSGLLETSRLKDANAAETSKAVVRSVGWHPTGQLLLTAGLDMKLRLFKVDGNENPCVQGVYLRDCPIHQASWASGGSQVLATGRRPFFYIYDLASSHIERIRPSCGPCATLKSLETFATTLPGSTGPCGPMVAFVGDQGYVPLVSLQSRQWVCNLKLSGSVRCAAWAPGGQQLVTLGGDGVVYTWDVRNTRRCVNQFRDYANIHPTAIAVSPDGRYLATGSESGALNLYPGPSSLGDSIGTSGGVQSAHVPSGLVEPAIVSVSSGRRLIKEVLNLTTAVDSIEFSHDSQVVAFASRMKKDAMRLLHLPSCTVFSNWPTSRSPLHYVHSLAFSPHSGLLTVGNARGRALLYRLHYYQRA